MKFSKVALTALSQTFLSNAAASASNELEVGFVVGARRGRSRRALTTEACPGGVGHVDCSGGYQVDANGDRTATTCHAACGGPSQKECCDDYNSCTGFTGRVCRDGSCINGHRSCQNANIELVSKSCDGYQSCEGIGSAGKIVNSCVDLTGGGHSCYAMGTIIGDISDSCQGEYACRGDGTGTGTISNGIHGCCNTPSSCLHAKTDADLPDDCTATSPPTTTPTVSPTQAPTQAPTLSPTAPGPLDLVFNDVVANFTAGATNELEVGFTAGVGRNVTVQVLKTCDKGADAVPPSLYTDDASPMVSHDPTGGNLTHSKIIVAYNFNKTEMATSDVYDATSATLSFCQVTSLSVPDNQGGSYIILQDHRDIDVKFDLTANFTVDVNLEERTVKNETQLITFDDDVEAYQCVGGSDDPFARDGSLLAPNDRLAICIRVQNNTSVKIDTLAKMEIAQDGKAPRNFVTNNVPTLPSGITEVITAPTVPSGIIVKTLLPKGPNGFEFENGKSLNISGTVNLKLATRRQLRALADENNVAGEETEVAEINVVVGLQGTADGFGPVGASDAHAFGKGLAAIGLMVLAASGVAMM